MWWAAQKCLFLIINDDFYNFSCQIKVPALKGQIISEQKCDVLNFPKIHQNIARISALASKMGQIKKIMSFGYIKWWFNLHDNVPLSFLFDPYWWLGQKSKHYFVAFLENFKTPQFCSEINWPLQTVLSRSSGSWLIPFNKLPERTVGTFHTWRFDIKIADSSPGL